MSLARTSSPISNPPAGSTRWTIGVERPPAIRCNASRCEVPTRSHTAKESIPDVLAGHLSSNACDRCPYADHASATLSSRGSSAATVPPPHSGRRECEDALRQLRHGVEKQGMHTKSPLPHSLRKRSPTTNSSYLCGPHRGHLILPFRSRWCSSDNGTWVTCLADVYFKRTDWIRDFDRRYPPATE